MKVVFRGYGDGQLVFEEHGEFSSLDEVTPVANRHVAILMLYDVHCIEIEFLDEPDPLKRFLRFGTDPRRMVAPMLPSHCADCGALLMGGATVHAPGCSFQSLIDRNFGKQAS